MADLTVDDAMREGNRCRSYPAAGRTVNECCVVLLSEEVARLRTLNAGLIAELHHYFGCDQECEKRHPRSPPGDPGGESDPPSDGQLLDVTEQAFSNIDNGYVEQDVELRKALATLCAQLNRNADAWWKKRQT